MQGYTNSVVSGSGESGGSDLVFAVNKTGHDLSVGDKVLLDTGTNVNDFYVHTISASKISAFFENGYIYIVANGNKIYQINPNNLSAILSRTSKTVVNDFIVYNYGGLHYINTFNGSTCVLLKNGAGYDRLGGHQYLGHGLCMVRPSTNLYHVCEINVEAGTYSQLFTPVGSASSSTTWGQNGATGFYDPDVEIVMCYSNDREFADFYNLEDRSAVTQINRSYISGKFLFATGLKMGDYLITTSNYTSSYHHMYGSSSPNVSISFFKIIEGYVLQIANDLPASLAAILLNPCTVEYNNDSKLLTVGTCEGLYLYRYNEEDKVFEEVSINIDMSVIGGDYSANPLFWFIDDRLSLAVVCAHGQAVTVLKLSNLDGKWYAYSAAHVMLDSCLTGFVTGNVNDEGLYEVRTTLPDTSSLTFNAVYNMSNMVGGGIHLEIQGEADD